MYFNCMNLEKYNEVKVRAGAEGYSMETVCNDPFLGIRYGFPAPQYSTHISWEPTADPQQRLPWMKTISETYG